MELATPNIRNAIYRALLGAMPLSDAHRKNLRKRGLSDDAIDAGGYATGHENPIDFPDELGDIETYLGVPGFLWKDGVFSLIRYEGILIPQRDLDGRVIGVKVRLDYPGGGGKCRAVSSQSEKYKSDGPSPGSPCHVPLGTPQRADRVIITEGELKADVIFHRTTGEPTLSFPGASQWKAALPVLEAMGCRTVRVAFDADHQNKKTVAGPMRDCIRGLRENFAVEVLLWDKDHGKGLDDLLVAGHAPRTLTGDLALAHIEGVCKRLAVEERPARRENAASVPGSSPKRGGKNGKTSAKYNRDAIDRWKSATDLGVFIAGLSGQSPGDRLKCPLCGSKSKALSVYRANTGKQIFKCWKCQARGDHFEFLEFQGMSFRDAYEQYISPPVDEKTLITLDKLTQNVANVLDKKKPIQNISDVFEQTDSIGLTLSHCPHHQNVWLSHRDESSKAALIGTCCHQWDCGYCGVMNATEHLERIGHHVEEHGESVYVWETNPLDQAWQALTARLRRKFKKDIGENHGFVRILHDDQEDCCLRKWTILATVSPHADAEKTSWESVSQKVAKALLDVPLDCDDNRVSYSRSWGPLEEKKKPKYEWVGTISNPKAARKHADELWRIQTKIRGLKEGNYAMNATGFSDDPELARQQKEDFMDEVRFHPLQDGHENAAKLFHLMKSIARGEPRGIIYPHRREGNSRVCTACGKVVAKGIHWCWQLGPAEPIAVVDDEHRRGRARVG